MRNLKRSRLFFKMNCNNQRVKEAMMDGKETKCYMKEIEDFFLSFMAFLYSPFSLIFPLPPTMIGKKLSAA